MKPLRMAVVGAGGANIATVNHLPTIARSEKTELVALCDINEGVRKYADEHDVKAYTDYQAMLDDTDAEAVLIATPDWLHCEQAVLAARAGKHILCEKPVALTMDELRLAAEAAKDGGVIFQAGHVRRFHPIARKIRAIIDDGRLGRVVHVRISSKGAFFPYPDGSPYRTKETGGQFIHNGPHYADWLCMFAGGRPVSVVGRTKRHYPDPQQAMETDNYTLATVRFDNGVIGCVEQNLTMLDPDGYPAKDTVQIIGTEASLAWCSREDSAVFSYDDGCRFTGPPVSGSDADPFQLQIEHFADSVRANREPETGLDNAEDVMRICTEAIRNA